MKLQERQMQLPMKSGLLGMSAILVGILVGAGSLVAQQGGVAAGEPLRNDEVTQRIDAAVKFRNDSIARYTVQELYSIYRNGGTEPAAQVTVNVVYSRDVGKEFTPVSATGSTVLRNMVIDKVLAGEKEMAKAANRDSVSVTSANYEMRLHPEHAAINGRDCIVMDIKARRKASSLLNGKGWFDAGDFTLVQLEGSPAASLSMFAGDATGKREYARVDGFSMAQHSELKTHNFLLGDTLVKIDYTDYKIQVAPGAGVVAK
jgi:hypothetical protein